MGWPKALLRRLIEKFVHHGMVLEGRGSLDLLEEDPVLGVGVPVPVRREVAGLVAFAILPINKRRMNLVVCRSACERTEEC